MYLEENKNFGEIIIYSSIQLFILKESPNSIISFNQSQTIKENKKIVFYWYNNKTFGILIKKKSTKMGGTQIALNVHMPCLLGKKW